MGPRRRRVWGSLGAGAVLLLVLGLPGVLLPVGRGGATPPERPARGGSVYTITLPDAAPVLPDGPNRDLVQAHCQLCHSPRLILTQPRMTADKWGAVVRKMITAYRAPVYGAPPAPDARRPSDPAVPEQQRAFEQAVVAYLMAVRGARP